MTVRVTNPCSTCGIGVPATPGSAATSSDRRAWAMSQVGRPMANPHDEEDPEYERATVGRLAAAEPLEDNPYQEGCGAQSPCSANWPGRAGWGTGNYNAAMASPNAVVNASMLPNMAPLPNPWSPTRKGARLAQRRNQASTPINNPGVWPWIAAGAAAAAVAGGVAYHRHQAKCYERAARFEKREPISEQQVDELHWRTIFDRGCSYELPFEVLVTRGRVTHERRDVLAQGFFGTLDEAATAYPFPPPSPVQNPGPQGGGLGHAGGWHPHLAPRSVYPMGTNHWSLPHQPFPSSMLGPLRTPVPQANSTINQNPSPLTRRQQPLAPSAFRRR